MNRIAIALGLFACTLSTGVSAKGWQCVTYARTITDVSIRGNANTWWGQAEGKYERGKAPAPGAVLAFKSIPGMRAGHVAVVKEIISDREVAIDHANWTVRGGVERNARAIDVSAAGDWSEVKVSYGSGMGTRVNPTFGFIYAGGTSAPRLDHSIQFAQVRTHGSLIDASVVQLAALESTAR
ncbi:MAG: CHAP domain-containing protein [Sphingomonadales bacterium]